MTMTALEVYRKCIAYNDVWRELLNVFMEKAIYGMLKSVLLLYLELWSDLREIGFKGNPCEPFVFNSTFNRSHMTIV